MTLATQGRFSSFPETYGNSAFSSVTLDGTTTKVAFIVQAPKTGTISKVGFRVNTMATPQTLKIGLQTLDSSSDPSGSAYGGSGTVTQASPAAATWYLVTLGTPATATQGDFIAVVIEWDSTTGNGTISHYGNIGIFPHYSTFASAAWTKVAGCPIVSFEYNDGSYYDDFCMPITTINSNTINTGTATDERGLYFSLPFPARVIGAWFLINVTAGGNYDVVLYDSDGTTALATRSVDSRAQITGSVGRVNILFNSPATLLKNTNYRLVVKPTTATSVTVYDYTLNTAASMDSLPGGQNAQLTTRADAGAWTQTSTRKPVMGVIYDQFDAGGGGLIRVPVNGGVFQ